MWSADGQGTLMGVGSQSDGSATALPSTTSQGRQQLQRRRPSIEIPAAKPAMQRLLDALMVERSLFGHGTAAEIDQQLGRSEGYLGRVLRGEIGLQVDMLFRIFEVLEVDPYAFFATVVGIGIDPASRLRRLRRQLVPFKEEPALLLADDVWKRLRRLQRQKKSPPSKPAPASSAAASSAVASNKAASTEDAIPTWLDELIALDELRFSDPATACEATAALLHRAVQHVETHPRGPAPRLALVRGLAIAASVERSRDAPRRAARLLLAALGLCHERESILYGELLERTCYQLSDHDDHEVAAELARQASELYLSLDYLHGVGRALVGRATVAFRLGQVERSLNLFGAALRYLEPSAWQSRFAAYQGKGLCHLRLQQIDAARRAVCQAAGQHVTRQGLPWWRLLWLQAEVAYAQGELVEAEQLCRQCVDVFQADGHPLDAAQLSILLCKVLLAAGRSPELRRVAANSMALLRPLKPYGKACTILQDLTRRALTSELTATWLDGAGQRLDREPRRVAR